jgi:hypothetical protein
MPYLIFDGSMIVPIALDSGERELEIIADRERAADTGALLESRTAVKARFPGLRTRLMPLADAEAVHARLATASTADPIACTGDLAGSGAVSCVAEGRIGLRVQTIAGGVRMGVVSFALIEV